LSPTLQSPRAAAAAAALPPSASKDNASQFSRDSKGRRCEKLPYNILKQLATDIEEAGGIGKFKEGQSRDTQTLARILDQRPDLYEERGHRL
jgi:hypothetical protein